MQLIKCRSAAGLILFFVQAYCLQAQIAPKTGSLAGTVFDSGGDPVPLAKVTLIDHDGLWRSVIAGQTGGYFLDNLAAGSYTLVASSPAFGENTSAAVVEEGKIVNASVILTIAARALDPPAIGRT